MVGTNDPRRLLSPKELAEKLIREEYENYPSIRNVLPIEIATKTIVDHTFQTMDANEVASLVDGYVWCLFDVALLLNGK